MRQAASVGEGRKPAFITGDTITHYKPTSIVNANVTQQWDVQTDKK